MLIQRIKCAHCKAEINSNYIYNGFCPVCNETFESARQKISNTGLADLKKESREYKKDTMTLGQIKRMFKLTENQISKIPSTNKLGEIRYYKTEIIKFIDNL
ncbi:MAG: hypothetical protein PHQ18_03805 [Patescibacteria group bacterium]|nr:hypothetical protein [Patescibacteria group bacterium]